MKGKSLHFKGKKVYEHIKEALLRGKKATEEFHGVELPGHFFAFVDAMKESVMIGMALYLIFLFYPFPLLLFPLFLLAVCLWKMARSALLGWARLERLHRLIEEERWEIEHHRESEKQELIELYSAKGFQGKLLDEVVTTLMADENRLLNVMLQEELGLSLEFLEHPIKQSFGAFVGSFFSLAVLSLSLLLPWPFLFISGFCVMAGASFFQAKWEKNKKSEAMIWHLSVALVILASLYFLLMLLQRWI